MADFRVTLFFDGEGSAGWSESYYKAASAVDLLIEPARELRQARLACLSNQWRIRFIRISNLDRIRDSAFDSYAADDSEGQLPGTTDAAPKGQYYDAAYVRLFAGQTTWRSLLVRGIPSRYINPDGSINGSSGFGFYLGNFINFLVSAAWGIRKQGLGPVMYGTSLSITAANKALLFATNTLDPALAVNDKVIIKGAANIFPANGIWRIRSVGGGIFQTFPKRRSIVAAAVPYPGDAYKLSYSILTITEGEVIRGALKKTGRPSYLPRGRRSTMAV